MGELMTREPDFTCFKDFGTSSFPHIYSHIAGSYPIFFPGLWRVLFSVLHAMFLLLILFPASPADAGEPKVFTDADLVHYKSEPMVDQETLSRMEDDVKLYEKKKAAEFLLEKEKRKRHQAEEAKKAALQKQDVTVSRVPVSNQSSVYGADVRYKSSSGSRPST